MLLPVTGGAPAGPGTGRCRNCSERQREMGLLDRVTALLRQDDGAQMVEYAFLLLGVALVVFVAAEVFGLSIRDALLLPMAWL